MHADPESARGILEALIAASSILGGGMAYMSGFRARQALAEDLPPELVTHSINEGIGDGFATAWPLATVALFVMVLSR